MKAIEIWRNGKKLGAAGLANGIVTAHFTILNQVDPIWFDVRGRDKTSGGHVKWLHTSVDEGEEFTLRLVDVEETQLQLKPSP